MSDPNESASHEHVRRLLTLLGQLFQEMGQLLEPTGHAGAAQTGEEEKRAPAARPAEPASEAPSAPEPAPEAPFAAEPPPGAPAPSHPPSLEGRQPSLYLVCEHHDGRNLAVPWNWVIDTHLSGAGIPEAFTLSHGRHERKMKVKRVLGIWTVEELRTRREKVHWLSGLEGFGAVAERKASAAPPDGSVAEVSPAAEPPPPTIPPPPRPLSLSGAYPPGRPAAGHSVSGFRSGESTSPAPQAAGDEPAVWIISPSALARRFLMRHLDQTGLDVHEARDLDDPLLPADLENVGGLFLDECLLEQWRAHPAATAARLPLVTMAVDGELRLPPPGGAAGEGAVLPRPFERSEVESVVAYLRSRWQGNATGRGRQHAQEEDDTWLFADPFGTTGTRERPGGG